VADLAPWRPARVRVGTVGKAHGLDGTFLVSSPCGWFSFRTGSVLLVDGVSRRVRRRAGTDDRPLVAFDGDDSREAADAIRGAAIELPREALPPPEPDSYFRFDLVGCTARQGATPVGLVVEVEDGVAHDVLVLDTGVRLPFVAAIVPAVDVAARTIDVDPDLRLTE
jgi:16S rRNA processing protein RimM